MVGRFLLFVLLLWPAAGPAADDTLTWREAVERLTLERGRAESGVRWLKERAGEDAAALAEGERLYKEARIRFEAHIEGLLVDLAQGREIADEPDRRRKLDEAVQHRIAFSEFVAEQAKLQPGEKNLIIDALAEGAGDIVTALVEGMIEVWKEWRRADELARKTIAASIERQKWQPFDSVS